MSISGYVQIHPGELLLLLQFTAMSWEAEFNPKLAQINLALMSLITTHCDDLDNKIQLVGNQLPLAQAKL